MADVQRTILHADMDAFFVSVELRRRPELVGKPVVVGGTGNRGVVAAASYEARRFGVHSALPSSVARRRCPHAIFLPGDHALYSEVSVEVREIFDRFTPLVEPLSLDEAFLDVSGGRRLFGTGQQIGQMIRGAVRDELDLGCCIGVAPNKFLAKLASVEAKPIAHPDRIDPGLGVKVVEPGTEQMFLDPLPVQRLWGVGPATLEKLHRLGVSSVADLRRVDRAALASSLGPNQSEHLLALAVGADSRPVEPDREAKSIGHEETYPHDKHTHAELDRELVRLADAVGQRLRAQGLGARTLTLKIRFAGFVTITRSVTTSSSIDVAADILGLLRPVLEGLDASPGVRLLGVSGSNLAQPARQLTLDDALDETPDWSAATTALDEIRERFGTSAIGPASSLDDSGLRVVKRGEQQWGPDSSDSRPGNQPDQV